MKGDACNKRCVVQGLLLPVPQSSSLLSSLRPQAAMDGADSWRAQAHLIIMHVVWCLKLRVMHEHAPAAGSFAVRHIAPKSTPGPKIPPRRQKQFTPSKRLAGADGPGF